MLVTVQGPAGGHGIPGDGAFTILGFEVFFFVFFGGGGVSRFGDWGSECRAV